MPFKSPIEMPIIGFCCCTFICEFTIEAANLRYNVQGVSFKQKAHFLGCIPVFTFHIRAFPYGAGVGKQLGRNCAKYLSYFIVIECFITWVRVRRHCVWYIFRVGMIV